MVVKYDAAGPRAACPNLSRPALVTLLCLIFILPYNRYLWLSTFWNAQKVLAIPMMWFVLLGLLGGTLNIPKRVLGPILLLGILKVASLSVLLMQGAQIEAGWILTWAQTVPLMICVACLIVSFRDLTSLYKIVIVQNLTSGVAFLALYLSFRQLWDRLGYSLVEIPRMGGGYGYRNTLAGLLGYGGSSAYSFQLAMTMPLLLCGLQQSLQGRWRKWWRLAAAGSVGIGLCNTLLTFQRVGYILVFVQMFVVVFKGRKISLKKVAVTLICVGLAGVLVVGVGAAGAALERVDAVWGALSAGREDRSVAGRLNIIGAAVNRIAESPLWGFGPGKSGEVGRIAFGYYNTVENGVVSMAYESGLPYAVSYCVWVFYVLWWKWNGGKEKQPLFFGVFLAVLSGFVYGQTQTFETSVWWAVLLGALLSRGVGAADPASGSTRRHRLRLVQSRLIAVPAA